MIEERFIVKEKKGVPLMYDNKTGGWYTHLLAHRSVLEEFCRIANNLNRKSKCCQNKMELMRKFVDIDAMNEYLDKTGQKGCD